MPFPDAVSLCKMVHISEKWGNLPLKAARKLLISNTGQMQNATNISPEMVCLYFKLAYLIAAVLWLFEGDVTTETFRN